LRKLAADAILIESPSNASPPIVLRAASESADALQWLRAITECCDALWLQRSLVAPLQQSHHAKSIVQSTIGWPDHLRDTVSPVVLQGAMKRWVVAASPAGGAWAPRRCFLFADMIVWCVPHANVDRQVFEGMSRLDETCLLIADLSVDDLRGVKSKRSTSSLFSAVRKPEPADAFQIMSRDLGKVDLPQSWLIDDPLQRRVWMHALSAVLRSFGSHKASKLLGISEANWATRQASPSTAPHRPPTVAHSVAATSSAAAATSAANGAATQSTAPSSTATSEVNLSDRSIESLSSSSTDDLAPPSMSKLVRFFGHTPTAAASANAIELSRSANVTAPPDDWSSKRSTTIRLRRLLHITPEPDSAPTSPTSAAAIEPEPLGETEAAFVHRFVGDAREMLAAGNALGALQEYSKALKLSRSPDLLFERAHALMRLERMPEAVASFDAILGSDPTHVQAKFWRSFCRQRAGDVDEALADLRDVVDAKEVPAALMAEALLRRATIELRVDNAQLALVDLTSAVLIDDQRPEPLLLRAMAHVVVGDVARALGDLDAAIPILVSRIRAGAEHLSASESRRQVRARTVGDDATSIANNTLRVPSQRRGSSSANSQASAEESNNSTNLAQSSNSSVASYASGGGDTSVLRKRPSKGSKSRAASTPDVPLASSTGSLRKRVRRRKLVSMEPVAAANLESLPPFGVAELGVERADDGSNELTELMFGDCDSVAWRPLCATVPEPPNAAALQLCAWRRELLWVVYLRGLALRRFGRVDAALASTDDGLRLAPPGSVARARFVVSRAACLTRQSSFPLAVELLNSASAQRERDRTLWYVLGLCHSGMGMVGEAARFFSRALDVEATADADSTADAAQTSPHKVVDVVRDFNCAVVLLARARSLVHLRLFMAAADDCNAVLALTPDVCTAHIKSQALIVRAQAYVRHAEVVGDVQFARKAVADCSTVLTTHQDDVNALFTRAQALMFADDTAASERDLMLGVSLAKLAQSVVPEALAAMQQADDLRMRGAHPSAIVAAYDTALESDPNFAVAVYRRARTMWNARRAASGGADSAAAAKLARIVLADLNRCLEMAPAFAPAIVIRSDVKRLLGDVAGANADADAAEVVTKHDIAEAEAMLRQMRSGHLERDARRGEQQLSTSQRRSALLARTASVVQQLTARDVSDAMESQQVATTTASRADKQRWRKSRRQRLVSQCLSSTSSDSYALAPAPASHIGVRRHSSLFDVGDLVLTLPSDDGSPDGGEYGVAPASAPHSPRLGARSSMLARSGGLTPLVQFSTATAAAVDNDAPPVDDSSDSGDSSSDSESSSNSSSGSSSNSRTSSSSSSSSDDGARKSGRRLAKEKQKQAISVPVFNARDLKIEERIGNGQFGIVWRAVLQRSGRAVAVKQLRAASEEASDKLMREASRMAAIARHVNVVALLGVVQRPPSLISELCTLGALKSLLAVCDPLTLEDVASLTRDTAAGLRHLHGHKTLHRDIAARNVLLAFGEGGRIVAKLADFGLARVLRRESLPPGVMGDDADDMQQESGALVPVKWMSPERLLRSEDGMASDVYSFGILLFEILTRQSPWAGRRNTAVAHAVMQGRTLKLPPHAPLVAHRVTAQCWLFAASKRPSMGAVCNAVESDWHTVELSALASSHVAASAPAPPAPPALVASASSPFIAMTNTAAAAAAAMRPRRNSLFDDPTMPARAAPKRGSSCAEDVDESKSIAGRRRVSMLLGDSADSNGATAAPSVLAADAAGDGDVEFTLRVYVAPAIALAVCRKFVDVAVSNKTTATDLIAACWRAVEAEYALHVPYKSSALASAEDCCIVVLSADDGQVLGSLSPLVQQSVVQFEALLRLEHGADLAVHFILRPSAPRFQSSVASAFEVLK
jgi:tetratricopeptide (TPR) repeat protein